MGVLAPVAPPGGPLIVGALPAWFEPLGRPPGEGLASEAPAVEAASQEAVALVYLAERVLALGPPALGAADSLELVAPLLGAPAGGALAVGVQCQGDLAGGVPGLGAVPQAVSPLPGALAVKALEAPHVGALALEQSAEEAPGQDGLAVEAGLEAALPLLGEPALAALAVEAGAVGAPVLGAAPAQGPVAQGDLLGVAWAPAVEAVLGPAPALGTPLGAFAQEIPAVEVLDQAGVCHEALSEGAVPLLGEPAVEADALEAPAMGAGPAQGPVAQGRHLGVALPLLGALALMALAVEALLEAALARGNSHTGALAAGAAPAVWTPHLGALAPGAFPEEALTLEGVAVEALTLGCSDLGALLQELVAHKGAAALGSQLAPAQGGLPPKAVAMGVVPREAPTQAPTQVQG